MSGRRRVAWTLALSLPLVAAALWLALRHDGSDSSSRRTVGARVVERSDPGQRALRAVKRTEVQTRRRRAGAEHAAEEPGPPVQALRLYAAARAEAEPVARRFHAAFARYELGMDAASELRDLATHRLARELLSAPPRLSSAGRERRLARLGRLELVPLAGDRSGDALATVELVGTVRWAGRRGPMAFELERRKEGWRVAGLGL